jgi:hypothetical protein
VCVFVEQAKKLKANIRSFSGFVWTNKTKERASIELKMFKATCKELRDICGILCLEKGGDKPELSARLMSFLENPTAPTRKAPAKKTPTKKTPSKSLAKSPAAKKPASAKRKKQDDNDDEEEEEEEEEEEVADDDEKDGDHGSTPTVCSFFPFFLLLLFFILTFYSIPTIRKKLEQRRQKHRTQPSPRRLLRQ